MEKMNSADINLAFLQYLQNFYSRLHPLGCVPLGEIEDALMIEKTHKKVMQKLKESFPNEVERILGEEK